MIQSRRMIGVLGAALAVSALAGCQVRPLYSAGPISMSGQDSGMAAELSSIAIKPVSTRYAQVVRNELIFAFGRGQGEPAAPKYSLTLAVTAAREASTYRQVSKGENEPSSQTMTLTANYVLTTVGDGQEVAKGRRQITSSFDVPRQAFAEDRARRDAENRAAKELALQLQLAIAQDLSKR